MSRRPANITQADIARALRAMMQVGYQGALEIRPDGTIRIIPLDEPGISGSPSECEDGPDEKIEL